MFNSLFLVALIPLVGPEAGEHLAAMPRAESIQYAQAEKPAHLPVLPEEPVRRTAAYTPEAPLLPQTPPFQATPATTPSVVTPTAPAPATFAPAVDPNVIEAKGILEIPKWNHVVLAANYQAMLMSLRTEQRDSEGKIFRDAAGNPVMVPLREGMTVFKDQVLGNFDDQELYIQLGIEEKKLDVALKAQEKRIEVEYAAWGVQTAEASFRLLTETNRMHEGAIAKAELLKSRLEVEQAKANLELQKYTVDVERSAEVKVKEQEVEGMKVRIKLRKIIAPITGMIVKVEKAEGEWLREGDPVLEIVQLDTLRVLCQINAKRYKPNQVDGKDVTVYAQMDDGRTAEFPGKVVFADPRVKYASDEFDVFIEVQNRPAGRSWQLLPGRAVAAAIKL